MKIAIPRNTSKIPTTSKQIHKILVTSKSKSEVITDEEEVVVDVFVLELVLVFELSLKFILTAKT